MSIHIHDMLDYLDIHLARDHDGSAESLLEMLCEVYLIHDKRVDGEIRRIMEETDEKDLAAVVSALCAKHEVLAFSHGVAMGMQLMTEIKVLP